MRQLSEQVAEAERVAIEADVTLANLAQGEKRRPGGHEASMLSDMHGRHHNYLRLSLTERYVQCTIYYITWDVVGPWDIAYMPSATSMCGNW